jgi:hypothetical protein
MTEILHSTPRERFNYLQEHTPTLAHNLTTGFAHDLNAFGRVQPPSHRTDITPARLTQALPELLTGGLGLGPQLHAFRRVASIKTKSKGVWRNATHDLLTDLAQHLDPVLSRARAQRIAQDAVEQTVGLVSNWLDTEAA